MSYGKIISFDELDAVRGSCGRIVCTSGGFDPIHPGHASCIIESKKHGDTLVVVVNGDAFLAAKKGKPFQDLNTRCLIVSSIREVDYVVPFEIKDDMTVCEALRRVKPAVFTKGGDRTDYSNIPEWKVCQELGIQIVPQVGLKKLWSSSDFIKDWEEFFAGRNKIQEQVNKTFVGSFGETPLQERIADIVREADEVRRAGTLKSMRTEVGQLICSCMQFCNEDGLDVDGLIKATLAEIDSRQQQYKALGRKVKVALFGGAFDPITTGHIQVAKYVLDTAVEFDEVWMVPCYEHLYGKKMTPAEDRLAMVELACKCDGRLKCSDYEVKHQLAGETYHFVKRLMAEQYANKRYNFSYIIGMDNANSFDKWYNFAYLEKAIRFVVVPRKGVDPNPKSIWYRNSFHICLPPAENLVEVSSTMVRELFAKGDPRAAEFLDPKVLAYIKGHGLYGQA